VHPPWSRVVNVISMTTREWLDRPLLQGSNTQNLRVAYESAPGGGSPSGLRNSWCLKSQIP